MNNLANAIFNSKQIRDCEKIMQQQFAVSEEELMCTAGQVAFEFLQKKYPQVHKILIFCGGGNNAGDGYVLARCAQEAGYDVVINQFKPIDKLPPTAQKMAKLAYHAEIPLQFMEDSIDNDVELIVDALLGTGLKDPVKEPLLSAITLINESGLPVVAIDVPSGLKADTGAILGDCVKADLTISFLAKKPGLFMLDGPDYCGEIIIHDLHCQRALAQLSPNAYLIEPENLRNQLGARPKNCHKGYFGHVLIIGGSMGMPGSVQLTACAALRVGAGLVTVATRPLYAQAISDLPEAMIFPIQNVNDLHPLIKRASVCVIGPGLGTDEWARQLFASVLASHLPMVIDASALHLLAENPQLDDNWILTPHPGEAAALLQTTIDGIQEDRLQAATALQQQYGGCVVLKGVGSLIRTLDEQTYLCNAGNPGMASGGMGDALSGIIAGLIAQKKTLSEAAVLGVWLHAAAADLAAHEGGEKGLIASDLMPFLRLLVNQKIKFRP